MVNGQFTIVVKVKVEVCKKDDISKIDIKIVRKIDKESEYLSNGLYYEIENKNPIISFFESSEDGFLNIFYLAQDNDFLHIIEPYHGTTIRKNINQNINKNETYFLNYDRDEFIYAPFLQENRDGTLKWRQQFDKIYYVFSKKEFSFFYNN